MAHWYDLINTFLIKFNFCIGKKLNSALMFIISNHNGRKCLCNLLQLEQWTDMYKVISDIMAHRYDLINTFLITLNAKKLNSALMFIISNHNGRKCLSNLLQLEQWTDMFKVISDIMAHLYELINKIFLQCKINE